MNAIHTRKIAFLLSVLTGTMFGQWSPTNWNQQSSPNFLYSTDSCLYALDTNDNLVYVSSNDGDTWTFISPNVPQLWPSTIILAGPNLLLGSFKGVFRSTDNGLSWTSSNQGLHDPLYVGIDTVIYTFLKKDSSLFAGTGGGIFRSTDDGETWSPSMAGLLLNKGAHALLLDGDTLFASTYDGIFKSTDNGNHWSQVYATVAAWNRLVTNDKVILANTSFQGKDGWPGVLRSTDHGISWSLANNGIWSTDVRGFASYDSLLFAATYSGGLFLSSDDGDSWHRVNLGASVLSAYYICLKQQNLFVAMDSSIWRGPATSITSVSHEIANGPVESFYLENPFPNPFNPSVNIAFRLSKGSFVSIKIYDGLSREVSALFVGTLGPGPHSFRWDGSHRPSGIYYARIVGDTMNQTTRLVLIK